MDMAYGIELDLREALPENLIGIALTILRTALQYNAYTKVPEWFNNDDNCAVPPRHGRDRAGRGVR